MRAKGAAPEVPGKDSSGSGFDNGNSRILPDSVPAVIRQRLEAVGVATFPEWLALGPRRYQIFGITRRVAETIDALVVSS